MTNFFRMIRRNFRYTWQIWTRGWSDSDTWSLDVSLSSMILVRLKRFKELTNGYPMDLTEEKWDEILDKMIAAFEIVSNRYEDMEIFNETNNQKIKEGLDLFSKYFLDLWW